MSPERIERIRRLGAGWVEQGIAPALQVVVARRGVVVLDEAWGVMGPEDDAPPLTVDAIFGLASMTKPFTATAAMCLVEDGLLGLNRPVQEYIPEFVGEGKEAVMVHHLLTHTSGHQDDDLAAYVLEGIQAGRIKKPTSLPGMPDDLGLIGRCFESLHAAPLSRPPGIQMTYCNYGMRLVSKIVSRVAGEPVEQFVQRRIFDPLGMTSTSYRGVPSERLNRTVRRASDVPMAFLNDPGLVAPFVLGSGSAYAIARDIATFLQMFLNGGIYGGEQILSLATVREMTRDQVPGLSAEWSGEYFPEATWGYGWGIQGNKKGLRDASLLSVGTFSHGGGGMSYAWADPALDLVGVYLSVAASRVSQRRCEACFDLFVNAVTAAIVD
jgi:CubicO group peptidase (beta-lactamase class C family)